MGTANAAGFGGSFATGLATSLMAGRDRKDAQKRRSESHALEAVKFMLESGQVQDIAELEPMLALGLPDVFGEEAQKKNKKTAGKGGIDGAGMVRNVLSQSLLQGKQGQPLPAGPAAVQPQPEQAVRDVFGPPPASGEGADPLPSHAVAAGLPSPVPPARRTLGGIPLLSPDEVLQRKTDQGIKADEAQINAKVGLARRILPALQSLDPSQTLDDAMMAVGLKTRASLYGGIQKPPQVGTFGDFVLRWEEKNGRKAGPEEFESLRSDYTVQRFGQEREAAANSHFGGRSYSQLTPEEQSQADAFARQSVGATAQARVEGQGAGAMNKPLTITQAQTTGGEVGTTSNDVLGQQVATKEQNEIRRAGTQLSGQLKNLRALLKVLPSDKDLIGGRAPGVIIEMRRRSPDTRAQVASLEAALNSMVNNVARVVAGAKGAQSEPDAKRAEAALVALDNSLKTTLTGGGDTQESAEARIAETEKAIEAVMKSLPAVIQKPETPVKPAAAGAGKVTATKTSTGMTMDAKGNILDATGTIIIPAGK